MSFFVRVPRPVGEVPARPEAPDYSDCPRCDHSGGSAVRKQIQSNGVAVAVEQCLTCGSRLRAVPKNVVTNFDWLPPFDNELREAFQKSVRDYWQKRAERRRAELASHDAEWWEWYDRYLASPQWHDKRKKVLARDSFRCRGCGSEAATQVHHLTYERVGKEMLFDLVAVCDACHDLIHAAKKGGAS